MKWIPQLNQITKLRTRILKLEMDPTTQLHIRIIVPGTDVYENYVRDVKQTRVKL